MASRIPGYGLALIAAATVAACTSRTDTPKPVATPPATTAEAARFWNSATVYFLLTDRFANGDSTNDRALGRQHDGALLRNFEGGDLSGIIQKLESGYFDSLGVTAIWITPFVEQIHAAVDEGTGKTYGYHGYWTRDWTAVDPALGTKEELRRMVQLAHQRKIRVLLDAVINHPGPITPSDPAWPGDWVRTVPQCTYKSYDTTVDCTLVPTLPDVLTESTTPVQVPQMLLDKWESEQRKSEEVASLDAWFTRTGHPRTPANYIIKWLTDWVREYGFDGYRIDTAKHFEEAASAALKIEAAAAFDEWKKAHPTEVIDSLPFYTVGEVYGYDVSQGRNYDFGDRKVDYFANGYDGLINFGFKWQAKGSLDTLFSSYSASLTSGLLKGVAILNYVSSHDDGGPLDKERNDPYGTAEKLLLAPGGAQIYYGDEISRPLVIPGAEGDANLRSVMPWTTAASDSIARILAHWRKLGQFRQAHAAIGAGEHKTIQPSPLVFSRILGNDRVVIGLDQPKGRRTLPMGATFADGTKLVDFYSGESATVSAGKVTLANGGRVVLLAESH
jgi:alpha-amylase